MHGWPAETWMVVKGEEYQYLNRAQRLAEWSHGNDDPDM